MKKTLFISGHAVPANALKKTFSRSSGSGGQNVNKLSTKVRLELFVPDLQLPDALKTRLIERSGSKTLSSESEETRYQHQNFEIALQKLQDQINSLLAVRKPREKTKAKHQTRLGKWLRMRKERWLKYKKTKTR